MIGLLEKRFKKGLVGYWGLNESFYDGTAGEVKDYSTNTNNGIAVNGATTSSQKVGNGVSFGATEYLNVGNDSSLAISGDLTLSAWVKSSNVAKTSMFLIYNDTILANKNYEIFINQGVLKYGHGNGATRDVESFAGNICDGAWKHLVLSCKSKVASLYVDSELISAESMTTDNIAHMSDRYISHPTDAQNTWDGEIDEVAIWNRALTVVEISEMYNSGIGRNLQFNAQIKGMINDNLVGDMIEEM